jgi:ferrous iron transport protein A
MRAMTKLHELQLHTPALVREVLAPEGLPEWRTRLEEIGFLPGEAVRLVARGAPGGDPLVVRIADSTFALRRAEAACVQVQALDQVSEEAAR